MHAIMMIYLLPELLMCCQATLLNISDQTLIIIDPSYSIYDEPVGSGLEAQTDDVGSELKGCINTGPKQYSCLGFNEALIQLVRDNTIVAINSSITLRSGFAFSNIKNVSITGHNKSVEVLCELGSLIIFQNCINISIQNITWNQCAQYVYSGASYFFYAFNPNFDERYYRYFFGLSFTSCTNISLKSCIFKDTMVTIDNAVSGTVCIDQIHFLSNTSINNYLATGIIIRQNNKTEPNNSVVVKFTNTLFSHASSNLDDRYRISLLLYILVDDPGSTIQVFVDQSNFSLISFWPSSWEAENGMFLDKNIIMQGCLY